jgi:hypothetical protein
MKIAAVIGLVAAAATGIYFGEVPDSIDIEPVEPLVLTGIFTDHNRVSAMMDNDPARVIAALETRLTQIQVDSIEAELWPVPKPAEIKEALLATKRMLLQRSLPVDDVTVMAIQERIDNIPDAVVVPE